jgi:hypothetical protein
VDVVSVTRDELLARVPNEALRIPSVVPDDTLLWSSLQNASGGAWEGCVYDAGRIADLIAKGLQSERRASTPVP